MEIRTHTKGPVMTGRRISVYIDEQTSERLFLASRETERIDEDLCYSLISEGMLEYFRHRKDDPGRDQQ